MDPHNSKGFPYNADISSRVPLPVRKRKKIRESAESYAFLVLVSVAERHYGIQLTAALLFFTQQGFDESIRLDGMRGVLTL